MEQQAQNEAVLTVSPAVKIMAENVDQNAYRDGYEPLQSAVELAKKNIADKRQAALELTGKIVGSCELHGEYSWGQCRESGVGHDECPACHSEKKAAEQRENFWWMIGANIGIPPRFRGKSFDDYQPVSKASQKNKNVLVAYANNFLEHFKAGRSLILCGGMGTGKTMLVCALAQQIRTELRKNVIYTTAYHLVREVKDTYGNPGQREDEVISKYAFPDLLIIDEVGVQFGSDSESLIMFEVLNSRYENMLPSIVISNVDLSELGRYLGDRGIDRLKENGGGVLVFDWESYRK